MARPLTAGANLPPPARIDLVIALSCNLLPEGQETPATLRTMTGPEASAVTPRSAAWAMRLSIERRRDRLRCILAPGRLFWEVLLEWAPEDVIILGRDIQWVVRH